MAKQLIHISFFTLFLLSVAVPAVANNTGGTGLNIGYLGGLDEIQQLTES